MQHALVISVGFGHMLRAEVGAAIRQNAQMTEGGFIALAAAILHEGAEVGAATRVAVFQGTDTFAFKTDAFWNNVARKTEPPVATVTITGRAALDLLGTLGEHLLDAMDARAPATHDDTLRAIAAPKNDSRASGAGFAAVLRRESEDALRETPRALSNTSKTMFFLPRTMRMAVAQTRDALTALARAPIAFSAPIPEALDVQEQPLTQGRVGAFIAAVSRDLEAAVRQWLQPEPLTVQPTVLLTDVGPGGAAARAQTAAAFLYAHPSGCLVINEEHATPLPGGCAGAFFFSPTVEDGQFLGESGAMP